MNIKKLTLAIAALGLSTSAFAGGYMGKPGAGNQFVTTAGNPPVITPFSQGGFNAEVDWLYLEGTGGPSTYAQSVTAKAAADFQAPNGLFDPGSTLNIQTRVKGNYKNVDNDYDSGYRINVGYHFPGTANDIQLTKTYYDSDDSDRTSVNNKLSLSASATENEGAISAHAEANARVVLANGPFRAANLIAPFGFDKAKGEKDYHYWAIDLDVGQWFHACPGLGLRLFTGLRYATLDTSLKAKYKGNLGPDNVVANIQGNELALPINIQSSAFGRNKTEFDGIGPRVGLDANYDLGYGFGLISSASGALLVGDMDTSWFTTGTLVATPTQQANFLPTTTINTKLSAKDDDRDTVVPAFEVNLGLQWVWNMTDESTLSIKGGYQVIRYDDVASAMRPVSGTFRKSAVNFDGPFLGVAVHFA